LLCGVFNESWVSADCPFLRIKTQHITNICPLKNLGTLSGLSRHVHVSRAPCMRPARVRGPACCGGGPNRDGRIVHCHPLAPHAAPSGGAVWPHLRADQRRRAGSAANRLRSGASLAATACVPSPVDERAAATGRSHAAAARRHDPPRADQDAVRQRQAPVWWTKGLHRLRRRQRAPRSPTPADE
jgi:hypothetical protein